MRELYEVAVDGKCVTGPVSRKCALSIAINTIDRGSQATEVVVFETQRLELRARWCRQGSGWRVQSVPAWLS